MNDIVHNHPDAATSTTDFVKKGDRKSANNAKPTPKEVANTEIEASPAAVKLAEENDVTIEEVAEFAEKNKIGKPDVEAYLKSLEEDEE